MDDGLFSLLTLISPKHFLYVMIFFTEVKTPMLVSITCWLLLYATITNALFKLVRNGIAGIFPVSRLNEVEFAFPENIIK